MERAEMALQSFIDKVAYLHDAKLGGKLGNEISMLQGDLLTIGNMLTLVDTKWTMDVSFQDWTRQVAKSLEGQSKNLINELAFASRIKRYVLSTLFLRRIHGVRKSLLRQIYEKDQVRETLLASSRCHHQVRRLPFSHKLFGCDMGFVGREMVVNQLLKLLQENVCSQRLIIAIIGVEGIGKSTLARKVYDNAKQNRKFDLYLWIHMPNEILEADCFRSLVEASIMASSSAVDDTHLINFHKELRDRRYLIVLDNLMQESNLHFITEVLPDSGNGSRIIVSTHSSSTASFPGVHACRLFPFTSEECSELMSKKLLHLSLDLDKDFLSQIGEDIRRKCDGSPLAVSLLAGLLAARLKEWDESSSVSRASLQGSDIELYFKNELERFQCSGLSEILPLSYLSLPVKLKLCLLYMSRYSEKPEIEVEKLIRLWVAEGMASSSKEEVDEDVAEGYLNELIEMGLVQVTGRKFYGRPKTVGLPRAICDYCTTKAREAILHFDVYDSIRDLITNDVTPLRRNSSMLRHSPPSPYLESKFLRVLDIEDTGIRSLPVEIENLVFLRYLGLQHNAIRKLPNTIGNLWRLQTLDVRGTSLRSLPASFWGIKTLRHILGFAVKVPSNVTVLKELQTLEVVTAGHWVAGKLAVLTTLRVLKLHSADSFARAPYQCHELPPNLTEVHLSWANLNIAFIMLGSLRSLRILCLSLMDYESVICEAGSFPQLRVLVMKGLWRLKEWVVEDGALHQLENLTVESCHSLQMFPDGFLRGSVLKKLNLVNMPASMETRARDQNTSMETEHAINMPASMYQGSAPLVDLENSLPP